MQYKVKFQLAASCSYSLLTKSEVQYYGWGWGEVDLFVKKVFFFFRNTYHDMICKNLVFFVFLYTLIRDSDKETKFELLQADSHIKSFLLFFSTHCLN